MRTLALILIALALPTRAAIVAESPFPTPEASEFERNLVGGSVFVKRIRVDGAVSLTAKQVADVVRPYENRRLGAAEIREVQQNLTRLYIDNGYVTSGVVVQDGVRGDELILKAVEGTVTQVRFRQPPRWSRPQYLTRLLVPDDEEPVKLNTLQERLAALRDSGVIDRIDAEIVPLDLLGQSELVVSVEEPRPFGARVDYDNFHSPAVGARRATIYAWHRNLTGWGDSLDLRFGDTPGLTDALASYVITIPYTRVRLGARYERSDSLAIDPPQFRALEIKSNTTTTSFEAGYTVLRRASGELALFANYDRRRGDTTLLGLPFSFITGIDDGVTRIKAWRGGVLYSARGDASVLFARFQVSDGKTNVAEDPPIPGKPATHFQSYFGQVQYAQRLPWLSSQAIARLEAQYTNDVLLPMEKYAIGGHSTVRGYRENLLLRDRAVLGSVEWQVPLTPTDWKWRVTGALFGDAAWSKNVNGVDTLPQQIGSLGAGLLVDGPWGLSGRVYYARPNHRWLTPNDDLQDRGVHFVVSWEATKLIP